MSTIAANRAGTAPAWPDFPADEYQARIAKVQQGMADAGFDLLILTKREHVVYFAGLQSGHWPIEKFPTAFLLVHARQDPVLVIPDYFEATARGSSWISRLSLFKDPHARPTSAADEVIRITLELAGPAAVIGLEMGQNMVADWNLADYHRVRERLPDATFQGAADVIWACRIVKSSREIELLREVVQISERALVAARDGWRSGITEREVLAAVAVHAFQDGADGVVLSNVRAGHDRYPMADSLPTDRPTELGEMVVLHVGFSRRSYVSELSHNTHVGPPTGMHRRVWATLAQAQEAVMASIRPGVHGRDVYGAYRQVMADFEFGRPSQYCGHGIGLAAVEPPYLAEAGDQVLKPGMVLALEPWVADVEGLGVFGLGEMGVVTDDGVEMLTALPREDLWWVSVDR